TSQDGGVLYRQDNPWHFTALGGPWVGDVRTAGMADLDGDGRPEVVAAGSGLALLYNRGGGGLEDVTSQTGIVLPARNRDYLGVTFADIDNDGLLDVAVTEMNCDGGANLVLRNEGNLHFADVAPQLGLAMAGGATYALAIDKPDGDESFDVWNF